MPGHGTASGFPCFEMERHGAEVVAFDLSAEHPLDMVPFAGGDQAASRRAMAGLAGIGSLARCCCTSGISWP